jgi:hypothetical protein
MLWRKKNRIKVSGDILKAIDLHTVQPAFPPAVIPVKAELKFILSFFGEKNNRYIGIFMAECDHVPVTVCPKALPLREKVNGFKQVSLPLCILSKNHIGFPAQFQFLRLKVSEVFGPNS